MFELIDAAHALGAPPAEDGSQQGSSMLGFLPIILMFLVLYLLMIRPQMKKQKAQQRLIDELEKGDDIVTSGGIHGTITNIKDDIIVLKIADNVKIEVSRAAVQRIQGKEN